MSFGGPVACPLARVYVRHFHQRHNQTWQLTAEGVELLRIRGVDTGSKFPTSLLMELVAHGMAYTEGQPRIQEPSVVTSKPAIGGRVKTGQRSWSGTKLF